MPLSAELQPLTVPEGTEFPGAVQELLELIAQYMAITGLNPFSGINFGDEEPSALERDRPWFKTDGSDNPVGWFAWNGAAWTAVPMIMPSGATADRPNPAEEGQLYRDTDIDVSLIYANAEWVTVAGSPGDIKAVKAPTLAEALLRNPGWSQDPDSIGKVIAGASDGSGSAYDYDNEAGADSITLTEAQLPAHTHDTSFANGHADGNTTSAPDQGVVFNGGPGSAGSTTKTSESTGDGETVDVRQPTVYRWIIVKD